MKKVVFPLILASSIFTVQNVQATDWGFGFETDLQTCIYSFKFGSAGVSSTTCPGQANGYILEAESNLTSVYRNGYILRETITTRNGGNFVLRINGSDDPETGFCEIQLVAQDENFEDTEVIYHARENLGVGGNVDCALSLNYDVTSYGADAGEIDKRYDPIMASVKIRANETWFDIARDENHPDYWNRTIGLSEPEEEAESDEEAVEVEAESDEEAVEVEAESDH